MRDIWTVNTVPLWFSPFFLIWAWVFGGLMFSSFFVLSRMLAKMDIISDDGFDPKVDQGIYCIWHEDLIPSFLWLCRFKHRQVWLNHPLWYMKPVHVMLKLIGVSRIILGSSGHKGKEAANALVPFLIEGSSTLVALDGPAGPAKKAKTGACHMGIKSGAPLIPVTFELPKFFRLPSWDKKRVPLPLTTMVVHLHRRINTKGESVEGVYEKLTSALN